MLTIDPKEHSTSLIHNYLLGAVAPRPIAFASTVDSDGTPNVSPFSFFNAFGANPPILVFSPARRGRDNTTKHTFDNIKEVPEVVINMVNYDMVYQASLASTEYPKGVNEFDKAGFTMVQSDKVRPYRVGESPVQFECKVLQVIETGTEGGAGNLVICEIVMMHINEAVLDADQKIDPNKIDLVARMGGSWYCRASGKSLFSIPKPIHTHGIGVDALPASVQLSNVLTGNNLGQLGNVEDMPTPAHIAEIKNDDRVKEIFTQSSDDKDLLLFNLHTYAAEILEMEDAVQALKIVLLAESQLQ